MTWQELNIRLRACLQHHVDDLVFRVEGYEAAAIASTLLGPESPARILLRANLDDFIFFPNTCYTLKVLRGNEREGSADKRKWSEVMDATTAPSLWLTACMRDFLSELAHMGLNGEISDIRITSGVHAENGLDLELECMSTDQYGEPIDLERALYSAGCPFGSVLIESPDEMHELLEEAQKDGE